MSSKTKNLGLLKKDPILDKNDTFNIQTMLNDNWDKLDGAVGGGFQQAKAYTDEQISLVTATGIPKLVSYPLQVTATEDKQTTFEIPLDTFDSATDTLIVVINRAFLDASQYTVKGAMRDGAGALVKRAELVLAKGVSEGSELSLLVMKNVPIGEDGAINGAVLALGSVPIDRVSGLQDKINEAFQSGSEWKSDIAGAITAKGQSTSATDSKATFIANINAIQTGKYRAGDRIQDGNFTLQYSAKSDNIRTLGGSIPIAFEVASNGQYLSISKSSGNYYIRKNGDPYARLESGFSVILPPSYGKPTCITSDDLGYVYVGTSDSGSYKGTVVKLSPIGAVIGIIPTSIALSASHITCVRQSVKNQLWVCVAGRVGTEARWNTYDWTSTTSTPSTILTESRNPNSIITGLTATQTHIIKSYTQSVGQTNHLVNLIPISIPVPTDDFSIYLTAQVKKIVTAPMFGRVTSSSSSYADFLIVYENTNSESTTKIERWNARGTKIWEITSSVVSGIRDVALGLNQEVFVVRSYSGVQGQVVVLNPDGSLRWQATESSILDGSYFVGASPQNTPVSVACANETTGIYLVQWKEYVSSVHIIG